MVYELQEAEREVSDRLDEMEYDPAQLDEIEERLDEIYRLKRKYGSSYPEIMSFYKKAQEQLQTITSANERIKKLVKEMKSQQELVNRLAKTLSDRRNRAGKEFVSQVEEELAFLDMPAVRLTVQNDIHLPDGDGMDRISLLISANQGELPKPLARIASGGELSRIMLAVKNVMWSRDDAGTMIFDEVDAGVSGRAAQKIGRKLSQAAQSRQVICVTHLAQIAACGDCHMLIHKEAANGQTYTRVTELEGQQRLEELAARHGDILERRGAGLMQGLVFAHPVGEIIGRALEKGLILISAGANIIRFVPPLIITRENIDEMVSILDTCID